MKTLEVFRLIYDLKARKAAANKNEIGIFAFQTPQHFTYFPEKNLTAEVHPKYVKCWGG